MRDLDRSERELERFYLYVLNDRAARTHVGEQEFQEDWEQVKVVQRSKARRSSQAPTSSPTPSRQFPSPDLTMQQTEDASEAEDGDETGEEGEGEDEKEEEDGGDSDSANVAPSNSCTTSKAANSPSS